MSGRCGHDWIREVSGARYCSKCGASSAAPRGLALHRGQYADGLDQLERGGRYEELDEAEKRRVDEESSGWERRPAPSEAWPEMRRSSKRKKPEPRP